MLTLAIELEERLHFSRDIAGIASGFLVSNSASCSPVKVIAFRVTNFCVDFPIGNAFLDQFSGAVLKPHGGWCTRLRHAVETFIIHLAPGGKIWKEIPNNGIFQYRVKQKGLPNVKILTLTVHIIHRNMLERIGWIGTSSVIQTIKQFDPM